MGVYHGGLQIAVAEQILDRSDVIALFEKMGGETVAERMDQGVPVHLGSAGRLLERALQIRDVDVVPSVFAGSGVV